MSDDRLEYWLRLAQDRRLEPKTSGKLGFMTTEDRYYDILSEISSLRSALGEACMLIKDLERKIERLS